MRFIISTVPLLRNLVQDVRVGFRIALKDLYSSLLMIGSLGLAIGACALVFSLVDAILYRPLPGITDLSTLVAVYGDDRSTPHVDFQSIAYPDYLDFKESLRGQADLTAYARIPVTLTLGEDAQRVSAEMVAPDYFTLLGVRMEMGTGFEPQDNTVGSLPAVVISHRLWQTRFGGDVDILNKTIRVNQLEARITGVAREGFGGVLLDWHGRADIWLPLQLQPRLFSVDLLTPRVPWMMCLVRLLPGTSIEQVRVMLQARAKDLGVRYPETNRNRGTVVIKAAEARFYPGRREAVTSVLSLLFSGAMVLLLVACFNTAGLLLARSERRSSEFGIRMALGARRRRIVSQLIAESLIIAAAAALLAIVFASLATRLLPSVAPMFHLDFETRVDERVMLMLLGLTFLAVMVFGLYPALRSSSFSLIPSLKSQRGQRKTLRIRSAVIVSQIGLSVLVITSAVLFLRQLHQLQHIDPGFEMRGIQVIQLDTQAAPVDQREALYLQLLRFVRTLPGVQDACLARQAPLSGVLGQIRVQSLEPSFDEKVGLEEVSPDYFRVLRLPLLHGRTVESGNGAHEAVVNEVMARKYWPEQNPIGHRILLGEKQTPYVIVGVSKASKTIDLTEQPRPFLYISRSAGSFPDAVLLTRSSMPVTDLTAFIRRYIKQQMRGVALMDVATLDRLVLGRLSVQRTLAVWASTISVLALFLVISGLGGVLSLMVSQRRWEMAIRLALGATPSDLYRWVLSQTARFAGMGLVLGFSIFLSVQGFLNSQLKEAGSLVPTVYVGVTGVVLTACFLASLGPGLRALRTEPAEALKSE
ncbi:MAG TPA: ABC transporter permease [Acidobacteriota bacterium]|nr:ABC transporter permease [Acidobacteriota bacterium]